MVIAEHEAIGAAAVNADEGDLLDAYSLAVSTAAERLIPSVASLRVRRSDGWGGGTGSGVAFTTDGFLLTSAHVVAGAGGGGASFVDGTDVPFEVVGRDPLSDLAVIRAADRAARRAQGEVGASRRRPRGTPAGHGRPG